MSDQPPTSNSTSRARKALVALGNKPELVALATLVTLVAFLWPICTATFGPDAPAPVLLTEAERTRLVAAAIAQLELRDQGIVGTGSELTADLDSDQGLEAQSKAIETIARADSAGTTYRVDTARVIEALQQVANGRRDKADEILRDIAQQQEEAGDLEEAAETYRQIAGLHRRRDHEATLEAYEQIVRLAPDDPSAWYMISTTARALGKMELVQTANRRGMLAAQKDDINGQRFLFPGNLAQAHLDAGEFDEAVAMWWQAVEQVRAAVRDNPDDQDFTWNAAFILCDAAMSTMRWDAGQAEAALVAAEEGVRLWEELARRSPERLNEIEYLDCVRMLASVQRMAGDLNAAADSIQRAIAVHRPAAEAAREDAHLRGHLLDDLVESTRIHLARDEVEQGIAAQLEAMTHAEFLRSLNPDDPGRHRAFGILQDLAGELAAAAGNQKAALGHYAAALETLQGVHAEAPWDTLWSDELLGCMLHLFHAHRALADDGEARRTGAEADVFARRLEEASVLAPSRVADIATLRAELALLDSENQRAED